MGVLQSLYEGRFLLVDGRLLAMSARGSACPVTERPAGRKERHLYDEVKGFCLSTSSDHEHQVLPREPILAFSSYEEAAF